MIFQALFIIGAAGVLVVLVRRFPVTGDAGAGRGRFDFNFRLVLAVLARFLGLLWSYASKLRLPKPSKIGLPSREAARTVEPAPLAAKPAIDWPHVNVSLEAADRAFAEKKFEEAEKLYIKAATQEPSNPKIYGRLGVIYLHQKNYVDAREALLTSLKYEKDVASRHYNLALAYQGLGDRPKARSAIEKAIALDFANERYRKLRDQLAG